jgi:hypothetical protein
MKKRLIVSVALSLLFLLTACNTSSSGQSSEQNPEQNPEQSLIPRSGPLVTDSVRRSARYMDDFIHHYHIIVYDLVVEQYLRFLEDPSAYVFDDDNTRFMSMFRNSEEIEDGLFMFDGEKTFHIQGGVADFTTRPLPIETELIDFAGSTRALQQFLTDNGVEAEISRHFTIHPWMMPYPVFIWLETNADSYFITISEDGWYSENAPNGFSGFYYFLYTHEEFIEKFGG